MADRRLTVATALQSRRHYNSKEIWEPFATTCIQWPLPVSETPGSATLEDRRLTMFKTFLTATVMAASLATAAIAADKPTDPQIAHIAYTAGEIDIAAAKQSLKKSKNAEVR